MRDVLDPNNVITVVTAALHVRGTVTAVRHIGGGIALRVTGRTNRTLATRALRGAGYGPVVRDEARHTLHIPARKATP